LGHPPVGGFLDEFVTPIAARAAVPGVVIGILMLKTVFILRLNTP
jgi:hypothetical protein